MFNKSSITVLISLGLIAGGYFSPVYAQQILSVGYFAFSGAVTNWLAIHMLFERVPLLYGSGVIPLKFEEFKQGIKNLMMEQFFTRENLETFMQNHSSQIFSAAKISGFIERFNYDLFFNSFLEVIQRSTLGSLLSMIGGKDGFEILRYPFTRKIKQILIQTSQSEDFQKHLDNCLDLDEFNSEMMSNLEKVIDQRLDQLTPQMVKDIIQTMIREHLGWLVVWGGVFGGLIGLAMSFTL